MADAGHVGLRRGRFRLAPVPVNLNVERQRLPRPPGHPRMHRQITVLGPCLALASPLTGQAPLDDRAFACAIDAVVNGWLARHGDDDVGPGKTFVLKAMRALGFLEDLDRPHGGHYHVTLVRRDDDERVVTGINPRSVY